MAVWESCRNIGERIISVPSVSSEAGVVVSAEGVISL